MNLKTQNKDSLEDAVSNSPDPSKQEKGLEESLHRWEDGRERACTYIEASGGGRRETEEPPWLLAEVYFGLQ